LQSAVTGTTYSGGITDVDKALQAAIDMIDTTTTGNFLFPE